MKLAIKGHPTRGKEVIQLLESLGGRNIGDCLGTRSDKYYYLDPCLNISATSVRYNFKESEIFTLEEFEKEFPFKVGDLCIYQSKYIGDINVKVLRMIIQDNDIVYEIGHKDTDKTYSGIYRKRDVLKPYKEMEERNITLTLDKAKEWYKKGGELREIALQAFTEQELNPLPRSWEEFCEKYPVKNGECWVGSQDIIYSATFPQDRKYKTWIPSRRSAKAHLAMFQLEQLRNCWINGWEPNWLDANVIKYTIKGWRDKHSIETTYVSHAFLSFPTYKLAHEFLECFRDLIEKAGDLI